MWCDMAVQQDLPQVPSSILPEEKTQERLSILQRICDTTESPEIYRIGPSGTRDRVRFRSRWHFRSHPLARFNWTIHLRLCMFLLFVVADREDIACGVACSISTTDSSSRTTSSEEELKIVQDFTRRKSRSQEEDYLSCTASLTMDSDRPSLDIRHFDDICPDKNGVSDTRPSEPRTDIMGHLSKYRSVQAQHQNETKRCG